MIPSSRVKGEQAHAGPVPPGRISGVCLDAAGKPLANARVDIFGPDGILMDTQTTNRQGRYSTRLLFAGAYRVELRGRGRAEPLAARHVEVRLGEVSKADLTASFQS